jgi:hypothetical protein
MRRAILLAVMAAAVLRSDIVYMVDTLLPRGGSRGSTVEVEFRGLELDVPRAILFYQAGIRATDFKSGGATNFKVKFQIAGDCPLGEHVLRVRTATALSDAVTFWVSPFPAVRETETKIGENDSIAKAQPVRANSTVEGQILPGQDMDRDFYRVDVQQGQRISVEVEAARLGTLHLGGENDLEALILDSAGKELARNDDSALYVQDPVVSVMAPRGGSYYVEIRQQIFYPPRQAWYRAHIGTFSRPTAIFPAGGQAGSTIEARVLGDPAGERTERIALPAKPGNVEYFTPVDTPPSGNMLRVSAYPNVIWGGGGERVNPPAALNGILTKAGETQTFRFAAKKGQAWKVQVYARTLGAPVDARIWIRAAGTTKNLVEADDARLQDLGLPSSRGSWYIKDQQDPVAVFRPPGDGEYEIGIEDTEGGAGPDHVYRIEIEPVRDTIYTHITSPDFYQNPRFAGLIVPRGGRWTVDVQLAQGIGNDYKGEIELEAVGLPRGVTMTAQRFTRGATRMPVEFAAAADAQPQAALIELLARPVDKAAKLESGSRQGFALTNRGGEMPWHFVFLDRYALAVTEPAPFDIELEPPGIALAQSGELMLHAKVTRRGDFKGAVEIEPDWLPPGVSKEGTLTIPAEKNEADFRVQANDKAAPGAYRIAMNASTTGGYASSGVGRVRVSSEFVELRVAQPYLTIDLQRGSVERGKQAELTGVVRQMRPFEGKAAVKLGQLPRGVEMVEPGPEITAADRTVVFHIAAEAGALAGLYQGVTCEVAIRERGQMVRQKTGAGVLRVDEAKTPEARQ